MEVDVATVNVFKPRSRPAAIPTDDVPSDVNLHIEVFAARVHNMHNLLFMHGANRTKLCDHVMQACVIPKANRSGKRSEASVGSAGHSMYLGPFHRAGSLSVADPDTDQPSTSGHPVDNRVDSLISRIRPARHSESRRHRVAQHVSKLVARCFSADHEVRLLQLCVHSL